MPIIEKELLEMEKNYIIERSMSSFNAPPLVIKKLTHPVGSSRFLRTIDRYLGYLI